MSQTDPTGPRTHTGTGTHTHTGTGTFEELVAEAEAAPTAGWDFSWFEGRATEERPSWGYARAMGERLARADAALDIQTGGGEVLAAAAGLPRLTVATEGWPPNVAKATALLHPRGAVVVASPQDAPLPFGDGAFDLVTSRHPVTPHWTEIARVLRPGGTYFAQHVGPASAFEVVEYFLGPQPGSHRGHRHPDRERAGAEAAGLEIVDLRAERLRMEFHDIGAVVHFLRKVVWMVPDFTVERYRTRLLRLHRQIVGEGPFVAHSSRHLVEARKPASPRARRPERGCGAHASSRSPSRRCSTWCSACSSSSATWWSYSAYTIDRPRRSPVTSPRFRSSRSWCEHADCSRSAASASSPTAHGPSRRRARMRSRDGVARAWSVAATSAAPTASSRSRVLLFASTPWPIPSS
ncbi:SAM-dependent methyltransferase [Streptomyces sp. V3I8]|nr:SAM-dependent methyltransferase [Streptomyces sp. V3I8]